MARRHEFQGGRFEVRTLEDLRALVRLVGERRRQAPSTLARRARNSNAIGLFASGKNQGTKIRHLLEILGYHQFTAQFADPAFDVKVDIKSITDLQIALFDAMQRRGLAPDRARQMAGHSGTLTTFMRRSYTSAGPDANINATVLMPFLEFFKMLLIFTDEQSPVIRAARREEERLARLEELRRSAPQA